MKKISELQAVIEDKARFEASEVVADAALELRELVGAHDLRGHVIHVVNSSEQVTAVSLGKALDSVISYLTGKLAEDRKVQIAEALVRQFGTKSAVQKALEGVV